MIVRLIEGQTWVECPKCKDFYISPDDRQSISETGKCTPCVEELPQRADSTVHEHETK